MDRYVITRIVKHSWQDPGNIQIWGIMVLTVILFQIFCMWEVLQNQMLEVKDTLAVEGEWISEEQEYKWADCRGCNYSGAVRDDDSLNWNGGGGDGEKS